MNASKLLKAVLRPRSLQTNLGRAPTTTEGPSSRRSLSPDSRLPTSTLGSKRSSTPVKMTCMCSPTNHPGSFRCRFHRAQKQAAVVAISISPKKKVPTRDSDILSEVNRCLPGLHQSTSRATPVRCSRLRNMTFGSGHEEEELLQASFDEECMRDLSSTVDCRSSTSAQGQSRSASQSKKVLPREIPTMFCQSTSRKALDAFDRNMTRMILLACCVITVGGRCCIFQMLQCFAHHSWILFNCFCMLVEYWSSTIQLSVGSYSIHVRCIFYLLLSHCRMV